MIAAPKTTHEAADQRVRDELEKILASRTFRTAEAQKKFLRYVVECTLEGRVDQIKEFAIGSDVFARGGSFDPRIDNIVRVEARKLRVRLARYYETEGAPSSVRIVLPPRGYVPAFQIDAAPDGAPVASTEPPAPITSVPASSAAWTQRRWIAWAAGSLAFVALAVLIWAVSHRSQPATPEVPSIAVLPFQNLGATNDDSFSDGLADELIDSLGSVPGLRVVARSSAFQFKSGSADIRQIGKRLNVRTVLEGSIRQYGDRLRINVEMDDATNGYRVWSASYDRDAKDALDVQREISKAIVDRLERQFSPAYARALPSLANEAPVDPEAYRDYLRGIYFWNKNTAAGHKTAIDDLQQALSRDPGYARAYAALARCYIGLPSFSLMPAREAARRAREFAQKSLELDPAQGEPHIYLGYAAMLSYDWATAAREFEKGLQMEPGNAVAHRWYANYLLNVGDAAKALAENQIAESLDPVSPYVMIGTARALHLLGRDDDAIAQNKKVLLLDPNFAVAHQGLGEAYLQKKMYSQAIAEEERAVAESGHNPARVASLAHCYAVAGNQPEARRLLENLLATRSGAIAAKLEAEIYSGLGDKDHAFEYLAKAVEERDNGVLLKLDPVYNDLRTDPRFGTLLAQMRLQ